MSIKEKAQAVRDELKKIGITSRQVSVRSEYCGFSTALHITIKDLAIERATVEKIAKKYEELDIDKYTGEILSGGNTYVLVSFDYNARNRAYEEYADIINDIDKVSEDGGIYDLGKGWTVRKCINGGYGYCYNGEQLITDRRIEPIECMIYKIKHTA